MITIFEKGFTVLILTFVLIALAVILGGQLLQQAHATTGGYSLPEFSCPAGQFVKGFHYGRPVCAAPSAALKAMPRGYGQ